MIDLHVHFLPWVDDGPRELAAAAGLLAAHASDGIRTVVLTPDIHPGHWDNTASTLRPRFEAFRRYADAAGVHVDLRLAGNVRLIPESLALVDADEVPYLGRWSGRRVLLVDFPDAQIPADAFDSVAFLLSRDIVPMISHPENNKEVKVDPNRIRPFVEAGCLLQVTAASVIGALGQRAQMAAWAMIEAGWVTAVATGAFQHGPRKPMLLQAGEALRRRIGASAADVLVHDNPHQIVDHGVPLRTAVSPATAIDDRTLIGSGMPVFQRLAQARAARRKGQTAVTADG